jgi:hypothetical protein
MLPPNLKLPDQQTLLNCRRTPANGADERGDQEQNNCHEKYDLGGLDRNASNAAEAKHRGNQRDDQKCYTEAPVGGRWLPALTIIMKSVLALAHVHFELFAT